MSGDEKNNKNNVDSESSNSSPLGGGGSDQYDVDTGLRSLVLVAQFHQLPVDAKQIARNFIIDNAGTDQSFQAEYLLTKLETEQNNYVAKQLKLSRRELAAGHTEAACDEVEQILRQRPHNQEAQQLLKEVVQAASS